MSKMPAHGARLVDPAREERRIPFLVGGGRKLIIFIKLSR